VAGTALPGGLKGPGPWQPATVTQTRRQTPRTRSIWLAPEHWRDHLAGQHYDVRLTAPDGYRAQRSYSVASSPTAAGELELTVDRLADGEVSPYLTDELAVGDRVEIRGPIGLYFVWRGQSPLLLVGGGSGVVPLMAMLRHVRASAPRTPVRLIYSVRAAEDLIYGDELGPETTITYTRTARAGWSGPTGRLSSALLAPLAFPDGPAFVCGSHGFVEHAARLLMAAGYAPERILTERFGPSG
jgi:ferredoxin-NADP reductase